MQTSIDKQALTKYIDNMHVSCAGKFFYYCLPYRKKIILNNMRTVFESVLTETQIERLALGFYTHLARSIWENIRMRFMSDTRVKQLAEVRGSEHVADIAEKAHGILILTGHLGNWELAPVAGIMNFQDFQGRFHFIRRTLKIKWLENFLFARYRRAGLGVIPKKGSLQQVCDVLEKNDAVIYVLDQHANVQNRDGIAVDFFGKPAGTYRSLASIARYMSLPVIPAASYRLPNGKHVLEFYPAVPWQDANTTQEAVQCNTRAYNQAIEKMILRHPEQWLWLHKRWKLNSSL